MKLDNDTRRLIKGGFASVLGAILVLSADMVMTLAPAWKAIMTWQMWLGLIVFFIGGRIIYSTPMLTRK